MGLIVLLIVLACAFVVFLICLRIGAAVTRCAVRLTNACCGGRDVDESDYRRGGGYQHDAIPQPKSLSGIRIPVPGVGYAILVNFLAMIASSVVYLAILWGGVFLILTGGTDIDALARLGEEVPQDKALAILGVWGGALLAYFLTNAVVFKAALPTTFLKAVLVVVWQQLICVMIGVALFAVLFAFAVSNGGMDGFAPKPAGGPVWVK